MTTTTTIPSPGTRSPARRSLLLAGLAAGYVTAYRKGLTYGTTCVERDATMIGDDLVADPQVVATHACTIPAAPERVWPWLVQVGWHRGGWYTPHWVDALLFPANRPSADRILEEHQRLEVGDFVPDGAPGTECGFVVQRVRPAHYLVLRSHSHLPLTWRRSGRAAVDWTWAFVLVPVDEGRATRFVFRWRARTRPWWLTLAARAVIVPADLVMSRGMLRGLSARAGRA